MAKETFRQHRPGWTAEAARRMQRKQKAYDLEQSKLRRAAAFRHALAAVKSSNAVWRMTAMGIPEPQAVVIRDYLVLYFEVKASQYEGRWNEDLKRKKEEADALEKRVSSMFRDDPERLEKLDRIESIWFGPDTLL